MTTRKDIIYQRLQTAFSPNFLEVVDESDQHIGHTGHGDGHRHFAVQIEAACLKKLSKVEAHRQIYALFTDMMPNEIHALRIKLL